jgi:ubiquinone/menaquinone biosynthesis C-methylase UbiE
MAVAHADCTQRNRTLTDSDHDSKARQLGAYANVDSADAGNLVSRLDAMHALDSFRLYKQETFDLLRLRPGLSVADIGCGTGEDARRLSDLVGPEGAAVGFDLSEAMLAQARVRHADSSWLTFNNAPADALGVSTDSFDGVRADRVLIHVPDPYKALNEMIRVTRPGGRIVVSEPDMPGCWVASRDHAVTDRIMREIAGSCISPYFARDLWPTLQDAGLKDVSLSVRTVTVFDPDSVGRILDFASVVNNMLTKNLLSEEEASRWGGEMADRGRDGRFVAGLCIMIAAGTKA